MNLGERDKKIVIAGGVAALAILVVGYGIIPMLRGWSGSSATLSSKAAYVSDLRQRLDSQEALVKQRNALVRRMGSLFEAPGKPDAKKDKKDASATGGAMTPETPKPETKAEEAKAGAVTPETPKPEAKAEIAKAGAVTPESPKPETKPEDAKAPGDKKGDTKEAKKDEPPKPEAVTGATLAGYVEQSAKKAEATVKSITPLKTTAGMRSTKYYRGVMLQVKVQCKAKGLLALLQALENGERFVKVEQVQVHRGSNKDDMDVTLDVRAYESAGKAS